MSMTKQQKLGACFGGAFGVIALALGWFLYSAYAEHQAAREGDAEEGTEGLAGAKEKNGAYYATSNPFPSDEAIARVQSNEAAYAQWKANAIQLASRGDCPPPPPGLRGTVFKNRLYEQVTRMQKLPGGVGGRICAPTFLFGFDQYLGETGGTPEQKDLPKLYAQLAMVTNVVDIFAKSGVLEIRAFERLAAQEEAEEENERNAKRRNKAKGKPAKDEAAAKAVRRFDHRLEYTVRASAFVKVLNGLAKSSRFYVVSDFGFEHEGDSLKSRLGHANSPAKSGGGKSKGKKEQEVVNGFVTNPETDPPILVHMKLSVYDFGKGRARADAVAAKASSAVPKKETPAAPKKEASAVPKKEAPTAPKKEASAAPKKEAPAAPKKEASAAPKKEAPAASKKEAPAAPKKEGK